MSIDDWVQHEQRRRRFNLFYALLASVVVGMAATKAETLSVFTMFAVIPLGVIGMAAGFNNVCSILSTPRLVESDEQIRAVAQKGPRWFGRLVEKLDAMQD